MTSRNALMVPALIWSHTIPKPAYPSTFHKRCYKHRISLDCGLFMQADMQVLARLCRGLILQLRWASGNERSRKLPEQGRERAGAIHLGSHTFDVRLYPGFESLYRPDWPPSHTCVKKAGWRR